MEDPKKNDSSDKKDVSHDGKAHEFKPAEHKEFDHSSHSHAHHSHHNFSGKSMTERFRENPWIVSTIVLGVVALILFFNTFSGNSGNVDVANKDVVTQRVLDFLDSQVPSGVEYVSTSLNGGLYEIIVNYQGTNVPVYVTADGENLVQGVTPFSAVEQAQQNQQNDEPVYVNVSVDDDPVKGNPSSKITIVEFSDFECPFCGKFYEETYEQLISAYVNTGKASLVFRDFPLSQIHPDAQKAAEAAECADEQGKFWEYHNKLFENQRALGADDLKQYAKDLNLNSVQFDTCLDSGKYEQEVLDDLAEGQSYGVTGTPAFFINGRLIAGAYPFEEFQKIIEEELAKSQSA